jgi:hypothetical protein
MKSRSIRVSVGCIIVAVGAAVGCIRRPVSKEEPTTKLLFETVVPQPAIDKIDLLLMVDNSYSMADKQRILADAVPDLVKGLVQPKCVDAITRADTGVLSEPTKPEGQMCPTGAEPAFPPITDMHIGVLSSSLGGMGSSSCTGAEGHPDDHGRLLARGEGGDVGAAGDLHLLAWYPDVEQNRDKIAHPEPPVPKITRLDDLGAAFRELVVGVGQDGCGLEAQLESVYRFLVQPDPWKAIAVADGRASYGPSAEVDVELLRQRAAFLRPDSLVAVVMLTDEDDSSADPLSFRGTGHVFMDAAPLWRPTAACAGDPNDRACTSCALAPPGDPGCTGGGRYTKDEDVLNVRFHHLKQRFGVDPQYPIARYVDGFTKSRVPSRDDEHDGEGNYAPTARCTNPLFAARLPTSAGERLCELPRGPRSPSLVYLALIGGVPGSLLGDPLADDAASKLDWTKILGRDPLRWDEAGVDPHMIQSSSPRAGLPPPSASDDADPVSGREWTTNGRDLELACVFDLYQRASSGAIEPVRRACPDADRERGYCDCDGEKDTPLCAPDDRSVQVKGKAYPTRRELMVVRELGEQGVVASLCPRQLTRPDADDYGYRPAVRAITHRLERSLVGSCLPRALERQDEAGDVACLVLATLPEPGPESDCARFDLAPPDPSILQQMRDKARAEDGDEAAEHPICEVPQLPVPAGQTCKDASDGIAFCYSEAPQITRCDHAITFTRASQRLEGARFTMQCLQRAEN